MTNLLQRPSAPPSRATVGGRLLARLLGAWAWAHGAMHLRRAIFALMLMVSASGVEDASAAVTLRASNSATGTAQDFSCLGPNANAVVTKPAGTVTGDLMIATVVASGNGAETVPTGWTLLAQNTTNQSQKVYYKTAAAGEPSSYTWTSAGFCAGQSAIVVAIDTYTGVDPTEPLTAGASSPHSGTSSLALPNDTALEAGSMRVSSAAAYTGNTTATTTSWSVLTPATSRNVTYGGSSLNVASAYMAQGAGATTSSTATESQSISNALAYTVVVRPKHSQQVGFTTQPVGGVAEGTSLATQPTVAIQYGDGTTNTSDTSVVTLSKASGPAAGVLTCTGGLTKTAVAGVASFAGCQITGLGAAGTYTIQATSPGLTSDTSTSFTIVAGAAAKLVFTTQPVGGVSENVSFPTQPSVTVRDAYDNTVAGDTGNVTIGIASGPAAGAVTGCTANPKAAVSGVATFASCKITGAAAAGTYTLSASRAGLTSGTSASLTITAGAANKLGFVTDPGDAAEGAPLAPQPAVAIQDSFGNTVTGNTSTVTLAKASGPAAGVLSCTGGLAKAAVSGVATFSGCTITGTAAIGTYTLSATGSFTATTSASFVISAGAATNLVFSTQPTGGVGEGVNLPTQPTVTVRDAYGNTVTSDTSSITLSPASGPGTGLLGCTANPKAASSGVATFTGCAITGTGAAGTYTLAATSTGLTTATSTSFTITAGAASQLAFTTQPVGGVSEGVNLSTQPTVTVQDTYGNTVAADSSTVTLAIASGPGTGALSCTGGLGKAAAAGVSAFAGCTITGAAAAGTYTLTATDGALAASTSSSFQITVGPASVVMFTVQPVGGVTEGTALPTQPQARVRDAYGNTVTSDTSTITLSIASGPGAGVLSCTGGLAKPATAGVATFAGCQITGAAAAGTYTLNAADGALTPAVSASFTIVPGAVSTLAFTTQPVGGVPEGTSLPTQPAVSARDGFGNTVTSYSSAVTLAIASGPGAGVLTCTANPRAATAGVAAFAGCRITGTAAAGSYTLTATDGATASATSANFTISVGAATKLVFATEPAGGVPPGTVLPAQPTVAIRDAYDNVATSDTSTVTLAVASGPGGTLGCAATSAAASGGSAAFSGCRINSTPGTYTLAATDGALTGATSASFVITVGTLSLTTAGYAFAPVSLNGLDQVSTATMSLHVGDTTGSASGWHVSAAAGGWTGGNQGSLTSAQLVTTPPTATCDSGPGTCTLASTSGVSWPISLTATPTVIYKATPSTGIGSQTVDLPMVLPIPGNLGANGAFSQDLTITIASGP